MKEEIVCMRIIALNILICFFCLPAFAQRTADEALASQYYQNGEYEKALSIFQRLFNKNERVYYDFYLNSLIKLKKYDEAEKIVKEMIRDFPDNYVFKIDYGRILQEKGQREKAADWYNELIKNPPANEFAIRDLSVSFYRAEAYDLAIKVLLNGRKTLGNETAFSYDLLSLYRYQKNKNMLVQEYLNLLAGSENQAQVLNQARNTFLTVFESPEDYETLKLALLRKIQKDPQNTAYSELLSWLYIQQKNFDMALRQTIALDKRLKEEGDRVYDLVLLLVSSQAYPSAIEGLQYLLSKGPGNQYYIASRIQILYTKSLLLTSGKFTPAELNQLEKDYISMIQEFGKNKNTVNAMKQLATLEAFHLNKVKEASLLLEEVIGIPGLPPSVLGQTKLDLGDIYILTGEVWEAALIYGQVEKDFADEAIGQEAKFRNARLSYYQGDFDWAKAQLDVLKGSTTQLIANDALNLSLLIQENSGSAADSGALKKYARADFLIFNGRFDAAISALDSINTLYPGNSLADDILMSKARICLKRNDTKQAVDLLSLIVANYSFDLWADDALFMLGDLYETKLNDMEKAQNCYQRIITDYPGSLFVTEARKRFRNLRGDNIG